MSLVTPEQVGQAYERLRELIADPAELKSKLVLLRQLLEGLYKKLSADSQMSFSGLFARIQYVHERLEAPPELSAQINQLRIACNKAAHEEDYRVSQSTWQSALLAIRDLLLWLAPDQRDEGTDSWLEQHHAEPFRLGDHAPKRSFQCVVRRWELIRKGDRVSGIKIIATDDDGMDCTIFLNDMGGDGRQWSVLNKVLWRFCTLNCLNLSQIHGRPGWYQSNPSTMIVVEPDFLIDASSVAECFTQKGSRPEFSILNRMVKEAASAKMVLGIMVNSILDDLVFEPNADYQNLFRLAMARQPISLVSLGIDEAQDIYKNIRDNHFPVISKFTGSLQKESVQLEPSYVCPTYGLQGRLDILHERDGKRHIVELKSGSPPRNNAWQQQLMQVVAYNLIIRDCGGPIPQGYSSILFSAARENPLRHVGSSVQFEQDLIMCRNRMVGIMHNLALDPNFFFKWLRKNHFTAEPAFLQEKIGNIVKMLNSLQEYEYQWFLEHLRLLMREIWYEKTGGLGPNSIYGYNALWQESREVKQERYRVLCDLKIEELSVNLLRFKLSGDGAITDFRAGDIIVLYRQDLAVNRQEILRGKIVSISGDCLEVSIRGGLRQIDARYADHLWSLEHDILESSLYSPLSSIVTFLSAGPEKRSLFLGLSQPRYDDIPELADEPLDQVVQRMFAARDYHIVQGPPGTGKTSGLLTRYIRKIYTETDKTLLILSFTNRAVDEICQNLRKHGIRFIRTGQSEEVEAELLDNLIEGRKFHEIAEVLKSCRVWVATVQSCNAWLSDLLKVVKINELVIDEASQIMENTILGIIARIGKTILIGDQNQLPPITRQSDEGFSFKHEKLAGLCYDSYGQSLMERLDRVCKEKGWLGSTTMLHQHYRMHDEIADLIQPYYNGRLISALARQKEPLPATGNSLLDSRLVWINFPPSRFAWYDPLQVDCVLKLTRLLAENGLAQDPTSDLGIVAPFRAMIHALRKELPDSLASLTIDTVERFQGSERKNIIITLPLHGVEVLHNVEALSADGRVDRKMNVAVSRAQERLFLLGCPEICARSPHYKFLMDRIRASGRVFHYTEI